MKKNDREIMEILEAFDLTGCAHSAAQLAGPDRRQLVDRALGVAATVGRFGDGDLAAIAGHLAGGGGDSEVVTVDKAHSSQPGTSAWEGFGR